MWAAALPALISAGASMAGGFMGQSGASQNNATSMQVANLNAQMQRETNAQQVQLFHENQDWQAQMSNTAYQRQMQDMREAGLNPILAYQKGGGASTPSTSPPSLTSPSLGQPSLANAQGELGRALGAAANSAVETYKASTQAELQQTQTELTGKQIVKTGFEANKAMWESNTAKELYDLQKEKTADYKGYGDSGIGQQGITVERVARRISDAVGIPFSDIIPLLKNTLSGAMPVPLGPQE